jgi:cytochrome P450
VHGVAGSHAALAQEVMLLNVAVGSNYRTALEDTTAAGVRVPKGTLLYLTVGRATNETGAGPDTFDPWYWLRGGEGAGGGEGGGCAANNEIGNFTWGHGPRRCIGQSLATVELVVLLAAVAREVARIEMSQEEAARPFGNPVFGHPSGLPLTLVPRQQ